MADNYLITGYWGEPHVTAENDRGINAATFGTGRFVLPVGQKLNAEYIGNNTIRLYDGKLVDNGAVAGIPTGEYVDLLIPNAGQGLNRNDLIVFQYSQDASTLIEKGEFVVIHGAETEETATDPELTQGDLLLSETAFEQMPLWRVSVSGAAIAAPVRVFEIVNGYGQIESIEHPGCYYHMVDGEQEWVIPPMVLGVEYRTTERYNGKVVYTQAVDGGLLPNKSAKVVSVNAKSPNLVSTRVMITNGSFETHLPFINSSGSPAARCFFNSSGGCNIHTYEDVSTYTATIFTKYTK